MIDYTGITFTIGTVLVVVVASAIAYIIYRAYSKPAQGLLLGSYEIFGRYAGGKLYKSIKGILVDSSAYFLNPVLITDFTNLILYDVDQLIARMESTVKTIKKAPIIDVTPVTPKTDSASVAPSDSTALTTTAIATSSNSKDPAELKKLEIIKIQENELELLKDARKAFVELPFQTACRMLFTRENIGGDKHLILQIGDTSKSITEYAMHDPSGGFSLTLGPVRKGVIDGAIQTLPDDYKIFGFGKCRVHIFGPFDPTKVDMLETAGVKGKDKGKEEVESLSEKLRNLARIVASLPSALDVRQHIKSLNDQLKDKDIALEQMSDDLTRKTVFLDNLLRSTKGFQTEGGTPIDVTPKKFDTVDTLVIIAGAVLGVVCGIALGGSVGALAGVIVGLIPSLLVVYKRH